MVDAPVSIILGLAIAVVFLIAIGIIIRYATYGHEIWDQQIKMHETLRKIQLLNVEIVKHLSNLERDLCSPRQGKVKKNNDSKG